MPIAPKPRKNLPSVIAAKTASQASRLRRRFKEWCENNAPLFREPNTGGRTNYVSRILKVSDFNDVTPDQPFPNNPDFRSERVLSERARDKIWEMVMEKGMPLKAVSAQYHVDMRRVAAVVRMKQIEKRWELEVSFFCSSFPLARINRLL